MGDFNKMSDVTCDRITERELHSLIKFAAAFPHCKELHKAINTISFFHMYGEPKKDETRKGIPDLLSSLDKIRELHLRKTEDYADANNAFSNFEFTEFVLGAFHSNRDKSYVWPIACKLARLSSLLSNDRTPNNESIEDSLLDIATYVLLWKADIARRTLVLKT